jgi:hypothetical protein
LSPHLKPIVVHRRWKEFRSIVEKLGPTNEQPGMPVLMALALSSGHLRVHEEKILDRVENILAEYSSDCPDATQDMIHRLSVWREGHAGVIAELEVYARLKANANVHVVPRLPPGPDFICRVWNTTLALEVKTIEDTTAGSEPPLMGDFSHTSSAFCADFSEWAERKLGNTVRAVRAQARHLPDIPTIGVLINRTHVASDEFQEAWEALKVPWNDTGLVGLTLIPCQSPRRFVGSTDFEARLAMLNDQLKRATPYLSRSF